VYCKHDQRGEERRGEERIFFFDNHARYIQNSQRLRDTVLNTMVSKYATQTS